MNPVQAIPIEGRYLIYFKQCNKPPIYANDLLTVSPSQEEVILHIVCTDGTIVTCGFYDCIVHDLLPDNETNKNVDRIRNEMYELPKIKKEYLPGYQ